MDYGEASCLAIALHRRWLFLTDDKDARKLARKVGVFISGTLGILKIGVERELISLETGNQLLKRMMEANYRSPIRDLTELFKKETNQ
ncbi:MAG: hypothetical protein AB1567_11425 [bacterium]